MYIDIVQQYHTFQQHLKSPIILKYFLTTPRQIKTDVISFYIHVIFNLNILSVQYDFRY